MNILEQALRLAAKTVLVTESVDAERAGERFSVCLGCEKRIEENNTCGICHCFLDIKTAAKSNWNAKRLRNEITHCPIGKWGDVEIANLYRQIDGKKLLQIKK